MNYAQENGWNVEIDVVAKVNADAEGALVTGEQGWTCFIGADELQGFLPEIGMVYYLYGKGTGWSINGISFIVDGKEHFVRQKTREDVERERIEYLEKRAQEKRDRYDENIHKWAEKMETLHPALRARLQRFERKAELVRGPDDVLRNNFWLEDGFYELFAIDGAQAILNRVKDMTPEDGIGWAEKWWALNTKEHDYNYKKQMEELPEFGEGHSGNTSGAAYAMAMRVLTGQEI